MAQFEIPIVDTVRRCVTLFQPSENNIRKGIYMWVEKKEGGEVMRNVRIVDYVEETPTKGSPLREILSYIKNGPTYRLATPTKVEHAHSYYIYISSDKENIDPMYSSFKEDPLNMLREYNYRCFCRSTKSKA